MRLFTNVVKTNFRRFSSTSSHVLEELKHRGLLRVAGNDASVLLQGLITNDMQHLNHSGSMFAMFLNNKGRVLYDTIIYRTCAKNEYILEVDRQAVDVLKKHISIYRLRREVDVSSIDNKVKIWAYFYPSSLQEVQDTKQKTSDNNVTTKKVGKYELQIFSDPRMSLLGSRILAPNGSDSEVFEAFGPKSEGKYKQFRYKLGVGEGIEELPPGNCFPLESNCDYLHGISFHKGCYIGQELTARSHHTGVIRKRLMPLFLTSALEKTPEKDAIVKSGETNVGKLRGIEETTGLGLLRIDQVLNKPLIINNVKASTIRPNWWPLEVPKERLASGKI